MMRYFSCGLFFLFSLKCHGQNTDTLDGRPLEEVVIKAFEQGRKLKDIPAAVNYIGHRALERFSSASIVQAVNITPGVRMEERSPCSYRFNIRGSALRSPFGIRNVKVYYNDIPLTDPGGHTYLNGLGYYNFGSLEIVKGPGSSLYGSGTGGVLLIESLSPTNSRAFSEYTTGSYGLRNAYGSIVAASNTTKNKIGFQHQESEGFRNHSALQRNIFSWDGRFNFSEKSFLKTTFLYSHLFYETPGALTKAEYEVAPKNARPAGGGFPSAEQSRASVQQKTFIAGASYTQHFSETFSNTSALYGAFTELRNPTIRNYGKNQEPHTGGRTVFSFKKETANSSWNVIAGAEVQQNFTTVAVYKNKNGELDTLQSLDDIPVRQSLVFIQASYARRGWELTGGSSLNFLDINFRRSVPSPLPEQKRDFSNEWAPRISLSKSWNSAIVYSSIARGFSPPTSAELLPSGSNINLQLEAEEGVNYDIGFRGRLKDFTFDVNAFFFSLQNTIVQRRDAGGGDYFINAGKTAQRGIETAITHPLIKNTHAFRQTMFWISHTWHRFRYEEFKQLTTDFSGKQIPGVAPHTLSTGIDLFANNGLSFNLNYYYSNAIPLNDANNEYAKEYHLLNSKLGYERELGKQVRIKLQAGVENIVDQSYSLGNDINAFGGRFYNAAARRNFYTSISVNFISRKQ